MSGDSGNDVSCHFVATDRGRSTSERLKVPSRRLRIRGVKAARASAPHVLRSARSKLAASGHTIVINGGPHSPVYDYLAGVLRSLLPVLERAGIATAADVQIDDMAERLRKEAVAQDACIMLPPLIGAWAQLQA
jgi:hypothetical protein